MSNIGKNIKKIRSVKKLNQTQFGELFQLNRGAVGAYEEERAEPKIDTIIQIANHFGLSVDVLLLKELTVKDLYSFNILNKKLDRAHHFEPTVSQPAKKGNICLVTADQSLEYLINRNNRDFISNLPHIDLPISFKEKSRAFEMEGSEMEYNQNGLHHGDILLCKEADLKSLKPGKVYSVVTQESIITRRLLNSSYETLELTTDDPNYLMLSIDSNNVKEIWQVVGAFSTYLNPPKMIEERVMLIENQLKKLKERLKD